MALGDGAAAANNLVVSFGEMLIDFVPDVAGLSLAESGGFVKAPGGAPANVACAISKLGGSSAFLGKVLLNLLLIGQPVSILRSSTGSSLLRLHIFSVAFALDPCDLGGDLAGSRSDRAPAGHCAARSAGSGHHRITANEGTTAV